ncbi:R144A ligase, partial [Polypterus senegalus]
MHYSILVYGYFCLGALRDDAIRGQPGDHSQTVGGEQEVEKVAQHCTLYFLTMTTARYRPTWDLALDPLVSCKLCLGEFPLEKMTTISQCQCIFCTLCLKQYVELLIKEGLEVAISCPDAACPKRGHLLENEVTVLKTQDTKETCLPTVKNTQRKMPRVPAHLRERALGMLQGGMRTADVARAINCHVRTVRRLRQRYRETGRTADHPRSGRPRVTTPAQDRYIRISHLHDSSFFKSEDDDAPIKRCPKCKVYIERDEGCAQMMCKNCKHAFCWYCLESLDDDFLLIHYDKGPCRNKLGHSRASVIWHRTQVVGIFAGFGLLLLVASPFLLLATPFVLCCKCKCSKGDDDPLPT